jgi:hypothetical protein
MCLVAVALTRTASGAAIPISRTAAVAPFVPSGIVPVQHRTPFLIMKADGDAHGRGATGLYGREFRRWVVFVLLG